MTSPRTLFLTLLIALTTLPLFAGELDQNLATAKQHIQAGRFSEAAELLEEAIPLTDSLPEDVQPQARTAVHFYAAVAYSGLERDEEALSHIREVLRISPEIRSVDPEVYDSRFVELFAQARGEIEGSGRFEEFYPSIYSSDDDPVSWALRSEPALEILATRSEKREWNNLSGSDARDEFMIEFWRARDDTPETERNEFRETFEKRVGFADVTFGSPNERGSLSDRGRVYVLLGEPARVRRRNLDRRDRLQVMNIGSMGIETGTIEFWIYTRDQLPIRLGKPTITYRFVSHQGIGDYVMQRDGMATNTLGMAAAAARRK